MTDHAPTDLDPHPTFRLALATLLSTLLLIGLGGYTRGSGSGFGCADRWPLCENGLLGGWLPRADYHMIIEWSHRWVAAIVGILAVATVVSAWRYRRRGRLVPVLATAALATIVFQAWIGRVVVKEQLDADLVSVHLAISLTAAAILMATVIATRFASVAESRDGMWIALVTGGAAVVFAVIMLGSLVHNLYFPGWPLMGGVLVPELVSMEAALHFAHRVLAALYALMAIALWATGRRRRRPAHEVTMLGLAALLYMANILVGAGNVVTQVSSAVLVALHLVLAAAVWVLTIGAAVSAARIGSSDPVA